MDKLCDNLPSERVKMFIDNGFDEWETVTYLKGHELIDIGFDAEECLIILITINNNAKEHGR